MGIASLGQKTRGLASCIAHTHPHNQNRESWSAPHLALILLFVLYRLRLSHWRSWGISGMGSLCVAFLIPCARGLWPGLSHGNVLERRPNFANEAFPAAHPQQQRILHQPRRTSRSTRRPSTGSVPKCKCMEKHPPTKQVVCSCGGDCCFEPLQDCGSRSRDQGSM